MIYKFVVSAFESIVNTKLYSDFYALLETEINDKWYWDQETQSKAQGLFSSCRRFDRLVAFAILYNALEPLNHSQQNFRREIMTYIMHTI